MGPPERRLQPPDSTANRRRRFARTRSGPRAWPPRAAEPSATLRTWRPVAPTSPRTADLRSARRARARRPAVPAGRRAARRASWCATAPAAARRTTRSWASRLRRPGWPRSPSTSAATARAAASWTRTAGTTWWPPPRRCWRSSGAPWVAVRGASMGGCMLLLAAHARPGLFSSLVALCPADGASLLAGLDELDREDEDAGAGRRRRREERPAPVRGRLPGALRRGRPAALPRTPRPDGVARGMPRVLLAHARDDDVVPFAHSERLAAVLAPPTRFIVLEDGGHHAPGRSAEVARATLDWVTANAPRLRPARRRGPGPASGVVQRARGTSGGAASPCGSRESGRTSRARSGPCSYTASRTSVSGMSSSAANMSASRSSIRPPSVTRPPRSMRGRPGCSTK